MVEKEHVNLLTLSVKHGSSSYSPQWSVRAYEGSYLLIMTVRILHTTQHYHPTELLHLLTSAHLHVVGMLRFKSKTLTGQACPLIFILFLCLFLSYGPFNCISFHKFSRQLSDFSLCSPDLVFAFLVLSAEKFAFSPDVILCGWLGSKHRLTNSHLSTNQLS